MDLIYNEINNLGILPKEIINYIFEIIYRQGCLILEDGTILDYYYAQYRDLAIFISVPENCNVLSGYVRGIEQSVFPKVKKINFHQNITNIFSNVFMYNRFLTTLELPDSIIELRNNVFKNCFNLKYIKLPKLLESIGESCFRNCISLEEIYFNDNLETIGMYAFDSCKSLKKLFIPKNIREIALYAFTECNNLEEIEFENKIGYFDYLNFDYFYRNLNLNNSSKITILHEGCFRLFNSNLNKIILKQKRDNIKDWISMVIHPDIFKWNESITTHSENMIYVKN